MCHSKLTCLSLLSVVACRVLSGYWLGVGALSAHPRAVEFALKESQDKAWLEQRLQTIGLEQNDHYAVHRQADDQLTIVVRDPRWVSQYEEAADDAKVSSTCTPRLRCFPPCPSDVSHYAVVWLLFSLVCVVVRRLGVASQQESAAPRPVGPLPGGRSGESSGERDPHVVDSTP